MDLSLSKKELILKQYKDYMGQRGHSIRTQQTYQSNVKYYLKYLESEHIKDISQADKGLIRKYQQHLYSQTKLSLRSQSGYLTSLIDFYRYLERAGLIIYNPATIIELPKYNRCLPRNILNQKQITKLFNAIDLDYELGLRERAICELFYSCGIRTSELLNLELNDIDLGNKQIMIRQGKGSKDRVVPIGEIARGYLEEYLDNWRVRIDTDGRIKALFISKNGRKLRRGQISRMFIKYRRKIGIEYPIGAHTLRHACATHMLQKGAPIRYIQELLGHAYLDTTQIYTKVEISDLKKVHKRCHPRELR